MYLARCGFQPLAQKVQKSTQGVISLVQAHWCARLQRVEEQFIGGHRQLRVGIGLRLDQWEEELEGQAPGEVLRVRHCHVSEGVHGIPAARDAGGVSGELRLLLQDGLLGRPDTEDGLEPVARQLITEVTLSPADGADLITEGGRVGLQDQQPLDLPVELGRRVRVLRRPEQVCQVDEAVVDDCLLYTSPSPRDS